MGVAEEIADSMSAADRDRPHGQRAMRIAYLVGSFPHISETFIVNQIAGMAARGYDVFIFTTAPSSVRCVPDVVQRWRLTERTTYLFGSANRVIRLLKAIGWTLRYGWRFPRTLVRALNIVRYGRAAASLSLLCAALTLRRSCTDGYDIVHCQFGTYGELALQLQDIGALHAAAVVSFRGFDATQQLRANPGTYRALFRRADLFLPVSETLARRLVDAGCAREKIVVHHSGIELAKFTFCERNRRAGEKTKILTIGRLTEKKGIEYAIRAVARVAATGSAISYRIVGEGPMRVALENLVQELDASHVVQFAGWRTHDEVLAMLEEAHILLAPSVVAADGDEEGIPNSVKEAMAMGIPVVATRHGGIPEVVEHAKSGYLVPERDVDALATQLRSLVDHPQDWAAIGRAARECVQAQFDVERLNDELVGLYQNVLRNRLSQAANSHRAREFGSP